MLSSEFNTGGSVQKYLLLVLVCWAANLAPKALRRNYLRLLFAHARSQLDAGGLAQKYLLLFTARAW